MDIIKEKKITEEYKEFAKVAKEIAEQDLKTSFIKIKDTKKSQQYYESQMTKHLVGMIEMYSIRYGDADERLRIVNYIEKNGVQLPNETWDKVKKQILSGEYKDLNET